LYFVQLRIAVSRVFVPASPDSTELCVVYDSSVFTPDLWRISMLPSVAPPQDV
jgi:hypothetical protein